MPNMTGDELSRERLRIRADIPIGLCTGFSEKVGPEDADETGIREELMKPVLVNGSSDVVKKNVSKSNGRDRRRGQGG
jgi:hypothetical protein